MMNPLFNINPILVVSASLDLLPSNVCVLTAANKNTHTKLNDLHTHQYFLNQ